MDEPRVVSRYLRHKESNDSKSMCQEIPGKTTTKVDQYDEKGFDLYEYNF